MPVWEDRLEAWHEVLPGVRRRILTHGNGVMMVLYTIAPNSTFPLHSHPHVQAGTFLEGGGRFRIGDEVYTLRKGSSYSIAGGVPHELVSQPDGVTVVLDIFVPERADFLSETVPPDHP